jgi:hypothetical protein
MREERSRFRDAEFRTARVRLSAGLGLALAFVLVCGLIGRSQSSGGNGGQAVGGNRPFSPHGDVNSSPSDDSDPAFSQRRMVALNIQRQKQMVADTDKLLKLAHELNDEVAAANNGSLTLDQLHKIAEIEKLAHNVRERMTEGIGQPSTLLPDASPTMFPNH